MTTITLYGNFSWFPSQSSQLIVWRVTEPKNPSLQNEVWRVTEDSVVLVQYIEMMGSKFLSVTEVRRAFKPNFLDHIQSDDMAVGQSQ